MNVYNEKLLRKSSIRKWKLDLSKLVTTWLSNIAFHLRPIWLQILVAIDLESYQTSFPSICVPPSEVAVLRLLDSNLSDRLHFMCDRLGPSFGCKLWLPSIQNCAWRITLDIASKLLRAAIWSRCAVQFEFEQTPFAQTGRRLRSAALRRIRFGTGGFNPMLHFYSETNEWSQDWARRWARLWSAATSCQFHRSLRRDIYKALNLFDCRTESVSKEW